MNVGELITALQGMPRDVLVTVDGYEGGVTAEFKVRLTKIALDVDPPGERRSWFGEHEELSGDRHYRIADNPAAEIVEAVVLGDDPNEG